MFGRVRKSAKEFQTGLNPLIASSVITHQSEESHQSTCHLCTHSSLAASLLHNFSVALKGGSIKSQG